MDPRSKKVLSWALVIGLMAIIALVLIQKIQGVFFGLEIFKEFKHLRQEAEDAATTEYRWDTYNLSFKYPKEHVVTNQGSRLYISPTTTLPEGESLLLYTRIDIHENTTIDEVIKDYKNEQGFSQSTYTLSNKEFIVIEYNETVTGRTFRHYLAQSGSNVLDYKAGSAGYDLEYIVRILPTFKPLNTNH